MCARWPSAAWKSTASICRWAPTPRTQRQNSGNGLNQHVSVPISSLGVQWAGIWNTDYPNAYCGHAPIGLTQAIVDAAVEISVQRLVEALKVLKDDSVMDPIIGASRKSWAKD